jgi:serine phosphatase RsbU (regulator of sigma subunit)
LIVLSTDGLTEATDEGGTMFSGERLERIVRETMGIGKEGCL